MKASSPRSVSFGIVATLATCALAFSGCARESDVGADVPGQASDSAAKTAEKWSAYRDRFIEDYFAAHPVFAVNAGRHEFDGKLPDWSAEGIAREIVRLRAAREQAAAFAAADLDEEQRFERDHLVWRIDRDLFWIETAEAPFKNPAFYMDWASDNLDPAPYITRNYAPLAERMRAYTAYARSIPTAAAQIKANLRLPLPETFVERGISAFQGFAEFYTKDVDQVFADVTDAALRHELAQANAEAARAMNDLAAWLSAQRSSATQDFALGQEKFIKMLRVTEQVDTPLAELEAIGRADLERNLAALKEACATFAPGKTLQDCFAKAAAAKPQGGAVEGARGQLAGLKSFIVEKGVVSIPGEDEARVEEAPPYNRANFAYIEIPGPYEKNVPAVYYIAPPDPSWTAQEQRDYIPGRADLLFTSVHEVWPGHFLQFLHAKRSPSIVGRLFVGYAYAEGWAHYAEEMMWEMGLGAGDAETHIGQLSNALLRNVRFLSAIGLHTGGMSLAESERMFREAAFQDAGTSRQQAARGTYDPAYLNYTLGKLMIRRLRADWTASRGGERVWREYHDAFLWRGGPPIPMVRRAMLGRALGPLF